MRFQSIDLFEGTFYTHNKTGEIFRLVLISGRNDDPTVTIERRSDAKTFRLSAACLIGLYTEADLTDESAISILPNRPEPLPIGSVKILEDEPKPKRRGRPSKVRREVESYFSKL